MQIFKVFTETYGSSIESQVSGFMSRERATIVSQSIAVHEMHNRTIIVASIVFEVKQ